MSYYRIKVLKNYKIILLVYRNYCKMLKTIGGFSFIITITNSLIYNFFFFFYYCFEDKSIHKKAF